MNSNTIFYGQDRRKGTFLKGFKTFFVALYLNPIIQRLHQKLPRKCFQILIHTIFFWLFIHHLLPLWQWIYKHVVNRKAWVGMLILYLNKYLSDVALLFCFPTVVYGTSWIRERMGSDRKWQFIPSSPLTDMSHSLMTLLCSLSLHLICVSVKPEQPTPAPLDSKANAHPFNDIRFGVMPFSIALILSSICIIQPATQPEPGR